jgi:hypothetical protein
VPIDHLPYTVAQNHPGRRDESLTRAALPIARAAGSALVAQEGAFGTRLLTRDICDPPLMFGRGGVLRASDFSQLRRPGFGVV